MPGTLYVVATPIGNLEDVTARALRVLKEVAVVAAEDTRRTAHLLGRYAITTPTTSLHEHNESKKSAAIVGRLMRGEDVALVSDAGTPLISDPGQHLIRSAIAEGIRVEPIPGPSAVMAALSASGAPTAPFTFLGFPPTRLNDRKRWLEQLGRLRHTVVFFEAPHRLRDTLAQIGQCVGDCRVTVCRELTKIHEQLVRGPISTVLAGGLSEIGEATVVVELGHSTDIGQVEPPSAESLQAELGEIAKSKGVSRRKALGILARKHNMTPNQVYDAIEVAKKLAK